MLFYISSSHKTFGSHADFIIENKFPLWKISKITLKSVIFPDTVVNCSNLSVSLDDLSVPESINFSIPDGAYSLANLLSYIQTTVSSLATAIWTFSFNVNTLKVNIHCDSLNFRINVDSASVFSILGFISNKTGSNETISADESPSLNGQSLFMRISELGSPNVSSNGVFFTFYIPLEIDSGIISKMTEANSFKQVITLTTPLNISQLSITLLDHNGKIANISSAWHFLLDFS